MIADLKFALRQLVKTPTFTIIATLTLALGIGANSAIFSTINALLLKPLPFPDPEHIVAIWEKVPSRGVVRNEVAVQLRVSTWSMTMSGGSRELPGKVGLNPAPDCSAASR